jgi:hypothetical protein
VCMCVEEKDRKGVCVEREERGGGERGEREREEREGGERGGRERECVYGESYSYLA